MANCTLVERRSGSAIGHTSQGRSFSASACRAIARIDRVDMAEAGILTRARPDLGSFFDAGIEMVAVGGQT
jgi:hypothetical protein